MDSFDPSILTKCVISPDFLRLFEEIKGVLFFVKDRHSRLISGNLLFAEHCGFSEVGELAGKTDFDIFPIELATQFRQDDEQVMKSGKVKEKIIELFPNYLGDLCWYITSKVPLFDADGKVWAVCGICQHYENSSNYVRPFGEIHKALDYLKENYCSKVTNKELAQQAGLSVRQFEKRFKKLFDCSAHQYLVKMRILKACDLLLSKDMTIADIALELGFYDQSAFSAHFKKQLGTTPLKYIKRHGK